MATTSTNFSFVIAVPIDTVDVSSHIAGNFSSIDSIIGVAHTGTGQLRTGLAISTPTLTSPVLVGTMTGGTIIATTGYFQTITATGGALRVNSFTIGTYSYPSTIGTTGSVLSVVTGNLQFVTNSPSTGANDNLSNLTTVAINTNMNTFTAGFITAARIIATSGALTGLTVFQATTGTFAGNVTVTGTLTANALNCTGGSITAASLAVGTYAYPAVAGSAGQVLTIVTNNAVFASKANPTTVYLSVSTTASFNVVSATTGTCLAFADEEFDTGNIYSGTAITISASGYYLLSCGLGPITASTNASVILVLQKSSTDFKVLSVQALNVDTNQPRQMNGTVLFLASSGDFYRLRTQLGGATSISIQAETSKSYIVCHKIPDT